MDIQRSRGAGVARTVLSIALVSPKGPILRERRGRPGTIRTHRWTRRIDATVMAGCLIDLAADGRIVPRADATLDVIDDTATGSPAHDLLLERAAEDRPRSVTFWVRELAHQVTGTLLAERIAGGVVATRRRTWLGTRTEYELVDRQAAEQLRSELQDVYDGTSTDAIAMTVLTLCSAAALPELVPSEPHPRALRRRTERLPSDPISLALGAVAAELVVGGGSDVATSFLVGDALAGGGGFDGGGGGDGG